MAPFLIAVAILSAGCAGLDKPDQRFDIIPAHQENLAQLDHVEWQGVSGTTRFTIRMQIDRGTGTATVTSNIGNKAPQTSTFLLDKYPQLALASARLDDRNGSVLLRIPFGPPRHECFFNYDGRDLLEFDISANRNPTARVTSFENCGSYKSS